MPDVIIVREGHSLNSSTDVWHLPNPTRKNSTINFSEILNLDIRWLVKRYIQEKLELNSVHYAYSTYSVLWWKVFSLQNDSEILDGIEYEKLKARLISLFEKLLSEARKSHRLWDMYHPIQWYIWSAENYPEIGFCPAYAMELGAISIPGNPKGEAVRMEDVDQGPLHRSLELSMLIKVMRNDSSKKFAHLQEKAALALSIALGRNPANLTYLKEKDLVNLTPDDDKPTWVINMPRIKKRQLNPRDDMLQEYLDPEFANYLLELIEANKQIETTIEVNNKSFSIDRPLFVNRFGNNSARLSKLFDAYFNMTSEAISDMLRQFVRRHEIISPLTGERLRISARRLRYTLGTALAAEGISKKELARILDHTDTQHVLVYFELAGSIIEHLDKATAKGFAKYLNLFRGNIVNDDSEAMNGDRDDKHLSFFDESNPTEQTDIGVCGTESVCHLDPPYSCYLCEKFQPYRHADHDHVLECLLQDRDVRMKKYENSRLGIQLDDVIIAVAQVADQCRVEEKHG